VTDRQTELRNTELLNLFFSSNFFYLFKPINTITKNTKYIATSPHQKRTS